MTGTIVRSFEIRFNGKVADTFYFRRGTYNHSDIFNNGGTVYDGDHLGACKKWEKLFADASLFAQLPGYEVAVIK